jgi:replicative DNA helicase
MKGGRKPYPAVYFASSSSHLASDVQSLLLRVGIDARIARVDQGKKGRLQFHVIVSGTPDFRTFVERIGAVGIYKNTSLREVAAYAQNRDGNTNRDIIPVDVWNTMVRPSMRAVGMTHRALHENLGMAYSGMTLFKQNLGRDRAAAVARVVSSDKLKDLAAGQVYWDRIASITPDGTEEVFDLTVPGPHNFLANDIVVHNSIEQDADVVLFLYRPEVYEGPETENRGKAELIIGKQRNGPTGTVNLTFIDSCTRFESSTYAD